MPDIHPFSQKGSTTDEEIWETSGKRGQRAFELAQMGLPIVPGFVIDSGLTPKMESVNVESLAREGLREIQEIIGRQYGATSNPLLLKLVLSSNLSLPIYPTVFNIGLSPVTIPGFAGMIGEKAAWFEYCYLLRTAGNKLYDIDAGKFDAIQEKYPDTVEGLQQCAEEMVGLVGKDKVPDDPMQQLVVLIKAAAKRYYDPEMDAEDPAAIMIQGMVFGNLGEDSSVGVYNTRNIITGDDELDGSYKLNSYTLEKKGEPISQIDPAYLTELKKIARELEKKFREIREVKFIVEKKRLWLLNQTTVDKKSTQSHIRTLLDLLKEGSVEEKWVVEQIPPGQLATLLHSIVDPESIAAMPAIAGGLTGAPGAAVGRVFFSADRLMEAHRDAIQKGEDTRLILVVTASYAEDVKAIEVGQGVISAEGGYSSHAPVVSRSLGKVSIVNSNIRIGEDYFELDGHTVREGDYVTMDAPVYKAPTLGIGKANLISPDIHTNGLVDFISVIKKFIQPSFVVRANADLGRDAKTAKTMGAYGIGLCRTEHMFFAEDRINRFREMILADSEEERKRCLDDLRPDQKQDFMDLFQTMAPYAVTIRLLDAPLHEFLPRNKDSFGEYIEHLQNRGASYDEQLIHERIERLHEFNPMLGHRGCRVAITYPEIYEMQVRAIFEAACTLKKSGTDVIPEIMIPIVMNPAELKFIKNGKQIEGKAIRGIRDVAKDVFHQEGIEVEYKTGTMIELPAAALSSDDLAHYAEFFSYGTNDLTQTTFGLSRDDANSFFPAYTEFDLLANNPFQVLGQPVKELIQVSAERGHIVRPDLKLGLCGEHGADPENIEFCFQAGLDYVSCSSYSVPIALLAVAQLNIKEGNV